MKTFNQFQEGLVKSGLKLIGKTKLSDIAKLGGAAYLTKKVANFLGKRSGESQIKDKREEPKIEKKPKYQNPGDGSIPGRYKDESLKDYNIRRNKGLQNQIDKI